MTFVGKILVILIMAFSLVFLGVSIVTFKTAVNWKDETRKQQEAVQKVRTQVNTAQEQAKDAQTKLDVATKDHAKLISEKEARIADLDKQIKAASEEALRAQTSLETAQTNAKQALDAAAARKSQIDVLTETTSRAQTQANQINAQNLELTDRIRILEREKATAEQNAKELRAVNAKFTNYFRANGISPTTVERQGTVPEEVNGRVTSLDRTGRRMELSIGSDDGLATGQELFIYRQQPRSEFLGKIKITAVEPDKSAAEVIGRTIDGKKILEGDLVTSTLSPR